MLTKQTHLVYYGGSAHGIKLFVMFFWLKTKASARSFIKFPGPVWGSLRFGYHLTWRFWGNKKVGIILSSTGYYCITILSLLMCKVWVCRCDLIVLLKFCKWIFSVCSISIVLSKLKDTYFSIFVYILYVDIGLEKELSFGCVFSFNERYMCFCLYGIKCVWKTNLAKVQLNDEI